MDKIKSNAPLAKFGIRDRFRIYSFGVSVRIWDGALDYKKLIVANMPV